MIVRSVRAALAALALVSVTTVVAQAQDAKGFGVSAGLALPTGDLSDAQAAMGFQVGGQYSMPLKNALSLRFNADYTRFGIDETGVDGSYSMLGGMANLVYNLNTGTGLKPYLLGGVGFSNVTVDLSTILFDISDSEGGVAFNVGAGYNFEMAGRKWFTEVRYVNVSRDGGSLAYIPVVLGLRF